MTADILILALVAGVIIYRLYTMLGKDVGFDGNIEVLKNPAAAEELRAKLREKTREVIESLEPDVELNDEEIEKVIATVKASDASFTVKSFLDGASKAFDYIMQAFKEGKKTPLRNLLRQSLYKEFATAIDAREKDGDYEDTTLVSIESCDIEKADIKRKIVQLTVRFVSEQISVTRNKDGEIVDGDPKNIQKVEDIWVFERELSSNDPNWKLAST